MGQAKLVVNGGVITITNGAALVIDNPDNTAITIIGSGSLLSNYESNKINCLSVSVILSDDSILVNA